ncbi:sensor histidine kinase [uncultured Ruthenibacterium sp.]|uniref:sensor histidine kinase n=1 Tax=uncultured Ruthenibacterium sp. TaxID=1905347 RepID=UPI00349E6D1C
MKFAQKLSCAIVLLVAASFSVGGFLLVWANFNDSLNEAEAQAERWHLMQCYALESDVLTQMAQGVEITDKDMQESVQSLPSYESEYLASNFFIRLLSEDKQIYSELDQTQETWFPLKGGDSSYELQKENGQVFVLLQNEINTPTRTYYLQSVSDISGVFSARNRQLWRLWQMEAVTLILCSGAAVFFSNRMTRPLRALSEASTRIAQGEYSARTGVSTADEIGQVSRNFDAMAQAVQQNVDELEMSVRQREDFMGAFSHELKTPMTAIIGYADTLRSMQVSPEQQRMAADYIFSEAKRVESLSRKLLTLLGLSEQTPELHEVVLQQVFRSAYVSLFPISGRIKLCFQKSDGVIVRADPDLLTDLVYNLVHNALKAEPKDGRVYALWKEEGNKVRITVVDRGCGIPADQIKRITEPFYMVDKSRSRNQGGSGMGLALCNEIARLHGTKLYFESVEGKGTKVSFLLDRVDVKEESG